MADALPPLTFGQWEFRDVRGLGKRQRGRIKEILGEMWQVNLPPETQCQSEGTLEESKRQLQHRGASVVEEYLSREKDRVSEIEVLGDVRRLRYGVFDRESGRMLGAWEWYAIRLHPAGVRMMPFPAFQRMGLTFPRQMLLAGNVIEAALRGPGIRVGGEQHDVARVLTVTYTATGREIEGDKLVAAWLAEIDGRHNDRQSGINVKIRTNPWGQETRTITWQSPRVGR